MSDLERNSFWSYLIAKLDCGPKRYNEVEQSLSSSLLGRQILNGSTFNLNFFWVGWMNEYTEYRTQAAVSRRTNNTTCIIEQA